MTARVELIPPHAKVRKVENMAQLNEMQRKVTRRPIGWFKPPAEECRDKATLPQLAESLKKLGQLCAIIATVAGVIIAGRRRYAAGKLAGLEFMDVIMVEEGLSDSDAKIIEITENLHRSDLTDYQKWIAFTDWLSMNPGRDQKDLAAEAELDESTITRYVTMSSAIPEVQEAFKNGLFGIGVGYSIGKAKREDQLGLLNMRLSSGASRDTLEQVRRNRRNGRKPVKTSRVQLVLPSRVSIVFNGEGLSLDTVSQSLTDALKEVRKAVEQQLDLKTLASVMKDKAKAKLAM